MYGTGNKKMLNMLILELLKKYSDMDHRLTQKDIIRLLELNYGMKCDRRSVKNNILSLVEMGYDISAEGGYCLLQREFEDAELRMLIDSVLFSKSISRKQAKNLIDKLKGMSNEFFNAKVSHISNLPQLQYSDNKQTMYSLDVVNDAISQKKKISFVYNEYDTDFKLCPKRDIDYIVNPYQLVANSGRYYLIGNYDKYDDISHYRVDKMTNVRMLEENVKLINQIKGYEAGFNLPKHMAEHIYMFSGKSVSVKMKVKKSLMNELIDWFGKDFQIISKSNEDMTIRVNCNEQAMSFWALQYGSYVEVLEPQSLRSMIKDAVQIMYEKYIVSGEDSSRK